MRLSTKLDVAKSNLPSGVLNLARGSGGLIRGLIRRRFLSTGPSPPADQDIPYSIHTLICHRTLTMGICSAKSLNLAAGRALPRVFHDDGSLTDADLAMIEHHLPGSIVARYEAASEAMNHNLSDFPETRRLRSNNVYAPKLTDIPFWSKGSRVAQVDTDILFFRRPDVLLEELEKDRGPNRFNKDVTTNYHADVSELNAALPGKLPPLLNAGLWVMNCADIMPEKIEGWLRHPILTDHSVFTEQTLAALVGANSDAGWSYLSEEYDVSKEKKASETVCKHYVGSIRYGFEFEGLLYLLTENRFKQRWSEFCSEHASSPRR